MLNLKDAEDIERIQKVVLKVIIDDKYVDYENACKKLEVETLEERRGIICLKFALKCSRNSKFDNIF